MFGFIEALGGIFSVGRKVLGLTFRIKRAIKEGRDVAGAVATMKRKYADLDDDVKAAWREIEEFADAIAAIFK